MEKKHISIIGTCVSREVFNDPRLEDIFDIDCYAFKVCPFSIFDESLNIPYNDLTKAPLPEFILRNLNYDLNKNLTKIIEEKDSEYIAIDLYSLVNDPIYFFTYNGKTTYIQTNEINSSVAKLKTVFGNKISFQKILFDDIDKNIIKTGLEKYAKWLNKLNKKVIVFHPVLSKKFFSFDKIVNKYSEKTLLQLENKQNYVDYFTNYFSQNLKNSIKIKWGNSYTARNIDTDFNNFENKKFEPQSVHLTADGYFDIASNLLKKLKIDYKKYYTKELDYVTHKYECMNHQRSRLINFRERTYKEILCSMNAYTNYLLSLKHHLIVFSVQADCQGRIKFWRNRKKLGLNFAGKYRDSYIGIIDTKNNFRYEKSSKDALTYTYNIPNTNENVFVESHGFYATNFSSIKFKDNEYSKGKRGFNILVLDLDTMQVVDTANCDTCQDDFLIVKSDFLSVFNDK